jgi:hypothetical protein
VNAGALDSCLNQSRREDSRMISPAHSQLGTDRQEPLSGRVNRHLTDINVMAVGHGSAKLLFSSAGCTIQPCLRNR